MIPIPPSHWLSWRHRSSERSRLSTSAMIVAPVVEKPDMPSKNASTGRETWRSSEKRYGSEAYTAASSQVSETTR